MISNRSILSNAGLAIAAMLVSLTSSCLHTKSAHHEHSLAVKAESEADFAHHSGAQFSEPEYFEGDVAPSVPAALPEERPKAPSSAHVWISGAHTRHDGQWVWVAGHYSVPPSPDKVWVPGHWVAHLHGFAWIPGAWR